MRVIHEPYKNYLNPADTLFAVNYLLGYFGSSKDSTQLMRRQKAEDLKRKNLWDTDSFESSFATSITINPKEPNFGVNVYAVGAAVAEEHSRATRGFECDAHHASSWVGLVLICHVQIEQDTQHQQV